MKKIIQKYDGQENLEYWYTDKHFVKYVQDIPFNDVKSFSLDKFAFHRAQ